MTKKIPALLPDHPMYTDAVDAMKQYHEGNRPAMSSTQPRKAKTSCALKFK